MPRGAEDLARAQDKLNELYNTFSQTLADTFGSDGNGGFLENVLDSLLQRTVSTETRVRAEVAASAAARLRNLELEELQSEVNAKSQLQRAEQLRQIRDDETKSFPKRIAANEELFNILDERNQQVVKFQERRLAQLNLLLKLDEGNQEIQKEILRTQLEIADINEETEGFRSEALINRNSLQKESIELLKSEQTETENIKAIQRDVPNINEQISDINALADARIKASQKQVQSNEAVRKSTISLEDAEKSLTSAVTQLAGEQSAVGRALAISEIVRNTATGISGAIAVGSKAGPFQQNLAAIASGVASVLGGIAQARSVLATDTGLGGSSGGGISTPSFNLAGASQQSQIIQPQLLQQFSQPVQAQAQNQNINVQSVVSVVDINKAQQANKVKVAESSL